MVRTAVLALGLSVLAAAVRADDERLSATQLDQLVETVGGRDAWGDLPPWRQRMILTRYRRFLELPADKQDEIRASGLSAWLIKPGRGPGPEPLPKALEAELDRLPSSVKPLAARLMFLRLMQVRLDRDLGRVPFEERRPLFRRLFPEPFDREKAKEARAGLEKAFARTAAAEVKREVRAEEQRRGSPYTEEERRGRYRDWARKILAREEAAVVEPVRRELLRFKGGDPKRIRRYLERNGYHLIERIPATPRQRVLIRYALRPQDCPFLDLSFLGEKPAEPAARRQWERDYRTLARVDLLSEAGFPPELVLHLADAATPEDFFRAVKALRR